MILLKLGKSAVPRFCLNSLHLGFGCSSQQPTVRIFLLWALFLSHLRLCQLPMPFSSSSFPFKLSLSKSQGIISYLRISIWHCIVITPDNIYIALKYTMHNKVQCTKEVKHTYLLRTSYILLEVIRHMSFFK